MSASSRLSYFSSYPDYQNHHHHYYRSNRISMCASCFRNSSSLPSSDHLHPSSPQQKTVAAAVFNIYSPQHRLTSPKPVAAVHPFCNIYSPPQHRPKPNISLPQQHRLRGPKPVAAVHPFCNNISSPQHRLPSHKPIAAVHNLYLHVAVVHPLCNKSLPPQRRPPSPKPVAVHPLCNVSCNKSLPKHQLPSPKPIHPFCNISSPSNSQHRQKNFLHPFCQHRLPNLKPVQSILRKIHNSLDLSSSTPHEATVWGRLFDRLISLAVIFTILNKCLPMVQSQFVATAQTRAIVLSLSWFLYKWKTNYVTYTLNEMECRGAPPYKVETIKRLSKFGTLHLCGLAFSQILGIASAYFLLNVFFIGVPFLYFSREILGASIHSWFEQSSEHSYVGDYINETEEMMNVGRRFISSAIPFDSDYLERFPVISSKIVSMLRSNANVISEDEPPCCYLTSGETLDQELVLECYLKPMAEKEFFNVMDQIRLARHQIIKNS